MQNRLLGWDNERLTPALIDRFDGCGVAIHLGAIILASAAIFSIWMFFPDSSRHGRQNKTGEVTGAKWGLLDEPWPRDGTNSPHTKPVEPLMATVVCLVPAAKTVLDRNGGTGVAYDCLACVYRHRTRTQVVWVTLPASASNALMRRGKLFQPEPAKPEQQEIAA